MRHVMTVTVCFDNSGYVLTQRLRRDDDIYQSGIRFRAVTLENAALCVRQQADMMVEAEELREKAVAQSQLMEGIKALAATT